MTFTRSYFRYTTIQTGEFIDRRKRSQTDKVYVRGEAPFEERHLFVEHPRQLGWRANSTKRPRQAVRLYTA